MTEPLAELRESLADRYAIERELGAGGMSRVYLARDLKHDRPVAIKVLRPEIAAGLGPERFVREIRVAAQLQHPHILPLYDSGRAGGVLYYVAPYVEGESLQEVLRRERQLPVDEALAIARQVAGALAYAHSHGIVHRDIKPGNILLEGGEAIVADFGIALAVSAAGVPEHMTETGLAVGTPAYMSPEQAAGSPDVDRRSDIYSLGCVLYEMLAGEPPFAAPTPASVAARDLEDAPAPLSGIRATIPAPVEAAVSRALAKAPGDRFTTATEFVAALDSARPVAVRRPRRWSRRRVAATATAVAAIALAVFARTALRPAPVDPNLHVVLPFAARGGVAAAWMTGEQLESLLYDAMARWHDVRLVGQIRAHDAWAQARFAFPSLQAALDVARRLGAGLLAWGEAAPAGDSIAVRAGLYDVAKGGRTIEEREVRLPKVLTSVQQVGARISELAAGLLASRGGSTPPPRESLGTTFLAAWQPYLTGTEAMNRLDVARAESLFRQAVRADPDFARAHLALAQAGDWAGRPVDEWLIHARLAVAHADRLSDARDSAMAWGVLYLAQGQFSDACDRFRAALRRDSLDVSAWFGLGECQRLDTVVVRDPRAAGGWRFRGSYEGAVRAYRRALEIAPSFNLAFGTAAYDRLSRLLVAEPYRVRSGGAVPPDTGSFMGWPALEHDSLVLVPVRLSESVLRSEPATHYAAVARGQTMLREIVERWVSAFPWSAPAHAASSVVLELQGLLGGERDGGAARSTALGQLREALRLETDSAGRLRLTLADVRLQLKLLRFGAARREADSLLAAPVPSTPGAASDLASAAALVGRANLAADLLARDASDTSFRLPAGSPVNQLRPATVAALRLLAYASVGAPVESIAAVEARVDTLVRRWVDRPRRQGVLRALVSYAALNAFPVRGWSPVAGPSDGYFLSDAEWLLSRGDTAGARARLGRSRRDQARFTSADVLPGLAYEEGWVWAAVGDTAAAEAFLDLSLENLQAAPTMMLVEPAQSAGLVRAMALRSRLAARRDPARARRWAAAVDTLWSGGDPELRAFASRLP
ncbi:MAG TPA: protein kinase [Gemmatimonadales bacterium]|nr:protein kinase [Gemmatimonadales bacterium]